MSTDQGFDARTVKPPEKPYRAGVTVGALLASTPLLGFLVTVYGMARSFAALGDNGISDQRVLAQSVGLALHATMVGLALCLVGVVILVLSLVLRARAGRQTPSPLPVVLSP